MRIGHENPHEGLVGTSVVSTGYGRGEDVVAHLGVLGPTRMDYPGMMGAVSAVAAYVGRILAESLTGGTFDAPRQCSSRMSGNEGGV